MKKFLETYCKRIAKCEKLDDFLDAVFSKELQSLFLPLRKKRKAVEEWIKLYKKDQLLRAELSSTYETTQKLARYVFPGEENLVLRSEFILWVEKYRTNKSK